MVALRFMRELAEYCDVTLVLSQNTGELLNELPENIYLIIDNLKNFRTIFKDDLKHFRPYCLSKDILYYARIKLGRDTVDNYRYLVERNDFICETEFDCAISYHGQSPERLLNLLYRTHAKKRVAWIHGEFNNPEDHYRRMERYYQQVDHLFFVSTHTKDSFFSKMTVDANKCSVYYNPLNAEEIQARAKEPCEPELSSDCINIVTVGRLSREKGQDMIPAITRNLLMLGYNIRWFVIGDGDTRETVEQEIHKHSVENHVFLLGTRANPYCFIRACDVYVQPSYTEGYSTTICEAGILGKAIVGTKPSGGIHDQITDGEDGLIVDATVESLTEGISRLLKDEALRRKFETEICRKNFEGKGEIQKFLNFLEE